MGILARHPRRAEQALPERAAHLHHTIVAHTGDNLSGLLPAGHPGRTAIMPQPASPRQTRFEVFYARLDLELPDARKSRQIGLCKRLNGNRKVRTVAETLSYTWSPSAANSL